MAVGRISGPLLKSNLVRNGIDLAFETDLLYLDVNNQRIGVKTNSPQHELDVDGSVKSTDLTVDTSADIGDINIQGTTISTTQPQLNLGTLDTVVYQNKAQIESITIQGNTISTNDSNANLEFRPNGTGSVEILSDTNVTGNIHATGNISADGNIIIGDTGDDSTVPADTITFNAGIASDIIPDATNTYTLGTSTNKFDTAHVRSLISDVLTTNDVAVDGIDLTLRQGNILYVAENGDDAHTGTHPQDPVASLKHALTLAEAGDLIYLYPGEYTEAFPLNVPTGVTVRGHSIRSVSIKPTDATRYNDCFVVQGESTVEELTIKDFYSGGNYFDVTARSSGSATVNVGAAPQAHTYVSGGTVTFEGPKVYPDDPATIFTTTASGTNTFTVNVGTNNKVHTYVANSGTATFSGSIVYPTVAGTDYVTTASGAGTVTVNVGVTTKAHTYVSGGTIAGTDSTSYNITGATYDHTTGVLTVTHSGPDLGTGVVVYLSNITFSCAAATYTVVNAVYDNVTGDLVVTHNGGGDTGIGTDITLANLSFNCDPDTANITGATYNNSTGVLTFTHDGGAIGSVGARAFLSKLTFSCNGGNRVFPDNGYGFRFATDFKVNTRSPYIRNITCLTKGSVTSADDPRGFNSGDAGKGAYIDGSYATTDSKEASMLFHSATFMTPNVDAITMTNGVRVEWLNSFTYFAGKSMYAFDSNEGKYSNGKTRIRLGGISGTFTAGNTITFTSTDSSTVVTATIESVENNDTIVIDGKNDDLIGFDTTPASISDGSATATTILNYDLRDFGAELRSIGSASVYGTYGLYGDGPGVIFYAIGHNLAYIGNGKEVTNDPTTVVQENEVTQLNGAKVRFNSVDHKGDFRVGDLFYVNQEDGTVSFTASELNINLQDGITFVTGSDQTFVNGQRIDTGNLRLTGNTISSTSGDIILDAFSDQINLQNDVDITGDLTVEGNVTVKGNITLGDADTDSISFSADVNSNIIPDETSTYSLGSSSKLWSNLFVDSLEIDTISIDTNYITTTESNQDLELRANGTGQILVPSNNVQIDNDLNVDGDTTLDNTTIVGTLTHTGDYNQTGNTTVTGNVTVSNKFTVSGTAQFEDVKIEDNVITTTRSNSDLDLRANGTGSIVIPSNDVSITQDLAITGDLTVRNITSTGTLTANQISTGDIIIDDNYITTSTSNSDLELRANGTGSIVLDDVSIKDSTISVDGELTLTPGSGIVKIDGTGSLRLPVGTSAERPTDGSTLTAGQMRFNSDTNKFEGYDGTNWIVLHGVSDLDGDTRITAELTAGADDDTFRFYTRNNLVATLDNTAFSVDRFVTQGIQIDNNTIEAIETNEDLELSGNGTGGVVIENFQFKTNTINNTVEDSITEFTNTGNGYVKFGGTYGLVIPVGDNTNKPGAAYRETGMIRFNTADDRVEVFDGTNWGSVAGSSGGISRVDAEEIAIVNAIIFG